MNETLLRILEKALKAAESTGQFIIEQGGDLLAEFFIWYTIAHGLGIVIGISIIYTGFQISKYFSSKEKPNDILDYEEEIQKYQKKKEIYETKTEEREKKLSEMDYSNKEKVDNFDFSYLVEPSKPSKPYGLPEQRAGRWYSGYNWILTLCIRGIAFLIGSTIIFNQATLFLKILVAPKLYLIDYVIKIKETL